MYRETRNYENIQIMRFPGEGKYDIPAIGQAQFEQADFIGFNYAKSEKHPQNKAVHFFLAKNKPALCTMAPNERPGEKMDISKTQRWKASCMTLTPES